MSTNPTDAAPRTGMSRNTKILLGVVAGILVVGLLCMGAALLTGGALVGGLLSFVGLSEERVASTAAEIAQFDLPAGFHSGVSTQIGEMRTVTYEGDDGHSNITIVQMPGWDSADLKKIREGLNLDVEGWSTEVPEVEKRTLTVAGAPVEVSIGEGMNSDDQPYRVATAVADLPSGTTVIVFERPTANWDDAERVAFFESIR
jgi:hypothetical protein